MIDLPLAKISDFRTTVNQLAIYYHLATADIVINKIVRVPVLLELAS